ncbi:hypothetical protein DBIPINDM_008165 (plasmid) [Mesorhizobium sp. AR02]|uniref:hypothetical protein n=1 Tax=Mesorhizobium sp. AR02 TaxID=2865837 RepID=UPI00215E0170|nr:hypothetical protein [Mesorhizobium sp. AR02]UVK57564.1 hypothetical protein DBIPINDM_008165 [Mesorhizobium sp. AR02]
MAMKKTGSPEPAPRAPITIVTRILDDDELTDVPAGPMWRAMNNCAKLVSPAPPI